jgi:hypothetical protein
MPVILPETDDVVTPCEYTAPEFPMTIITAKSANTNTFLIVFFIIVLFG